MSTEVGLTPYPKLSGALHGKTKIALSPQNGETSMKCETCGMSENENPAHASDYSGSGKHSFTSAKKSLDPADMVLTDDSEVSFNCGAVKAMGNGLIGGFAIIHTSETDPDLTDDFFDGSTNYFFEGEKAIRPSLFDHGQDPDLGDREFGPVSLERKSAGVWFQHQLKMADDYDKYIYALAQKGKLGVSTGSAPHMIKREKVGSVNRIKSWPIVELSYTVKPIEPKTKKAMSLKSYLELEEATDPALSFKGVVEEQDEDFRGPHEFEPSDDDSEKCKLCDEELADGMHVTKKALEFIKGGPGSGPQGGSGGDKGIGSKGDKVRIGSLQDHSKHGEVKVAYHHDNGKSDVIDLNGDKHTVSTKELSPAGKKALEILDRPMKGIFEEELAETGTSFYDLNRVYCEVMKDIASAADTVDISGGEVNLQFKVTEATTEYAARLIQLMVGQIQDWLDAGGSDARSTDSLGSGSSFYVKSLFDAASPLQFLLSVKKSLVSGGQLDEHSARVVSAIGEFADQCVSFNDHIKNWSGRCEDKIQFRAADSTKSGRTISAATHGKLTEAHQKLGDALAAGAESHAHIGKLMELANPEKKAIDILELQFMLDNSKHELEMAGVPLSIH